MDSTNESNPARPWTALVSAVAIIEVASAIRFANALVASVASPASVVEIALAMLSPNIVFDKVFNKAAHKVTTESLLKIPAAVMFELERL